MRSSMVLGVLSLLLPLLAWASTVAEASQHATRPSAASGIDVETAAYQLARMGVLEEPDGRSPTEAMTWGELVVYLYRLSRAIDARMSGVHPMRGWSSYDWLQGWGEDTTIPGIDWTVGPPGPMGPPGPPGPCGPGITPEQQVLLERLGSEFAPELHTLRSDLSSLGNRVQDLEVAGPKSPPTGTSSSDSDKQGMLGGPNECGIGVSGLPEVNFTALHSTTERSMLGTVSGASYVACPSGTGAAEVEQLRAAVQRLQDTVNRQAAVIDLLCKAYAGQAEPVAMATLAER
jgi:hypothetical protein